MTAPPAPSDLHANFAGLQGGQQRRVARRDAELALRPRHEHHACLAREHLAFGADDIDVNGVGHGSLSGQRLGFFDRFFDGADHVERLLGQVVVFARDDGLEAADRVLEGHDLAVLSGEHLGDIERLR